MILQSKITMKKTNKKIVFVHSLNGYTGSPKVLSLVIKGFAQKGYDLELITSRGNGFLAGINGVIYKYTSYKWTNYRGLTFLYLLLSQIHVFFIILFRRRQNTIFYINTITPIGAVWACKLSRKKMIYHVHEVMTLKKILYPIYKYTYKFCNSKSIFVSNYLKKSAVGVKNGIVVYNSLEKEFFSQKLFEGEKTSNLQKSNVVMVASLRKFKGIYEFVELSKKMPQYSFELVLSASESEVNDFKEKVQPNENLSLYPMQTNLHPFYNKAKLLLQLSHTNECTETFGLTILEGLAYGLPAIVPNIGGPTELITDGVNGFQVDTRNVEEIKEKIILLMEREELYVEFSNNALGKSKEFSEEKMITEIEKYIY